MFARPRFWLYRTILGIVTARAFEQHRVWPLETPSREHIDVEPLAPEFPRLFDAKNFPATEHAEQRLKDIRRRARLLPIAAKLPATRTAEISDDHDRFLDQIYPTRYRKVWPTAPTEPPEFHSDDVLASLATSGPFALYLQRGWTVDDLEQASLGAASPDDYVFDMTGFEDYPVKPGLLTLGGFAVFTVDGDRLRTAGIVYDGELHRPDSRGFERASRVVLCAMNTHLTTLLHNITIHLGFVTPMAVASTNELSPDHPIRRLLQPGFQTALIGNHELATFQIMGERSFAARLFSHDHPTLVALINDHLADFHPADLDPEMMFARHGLVDAPVPLPFWEDDLALWRIHLDYVERYVELYFHDDAAVAGDAELTAWAASLDHLLPSGLYDDQDHHDQDHHDQDQDDQDHHDDGLVAGTPLTRNALGRLCANYLHTSSATHDVVNNAVWDYSTLNYVVPTVVPETLEHQDVRLSFDLMNTLLGTWKPFNMLIDGVSELALDDAGRAVMDDYVDALRSRQADMGTEPRRAGRIYPAELNPSVTN